MTETIDDLRRRFSLALEQAKTPADLENIQRDFLGKKSELKAAFQNLRLLSAEQKTATAKMLNETQQAWEKAIAEAREVAEARALEARLSGEWVDLSLPGTVAGRGALHPVTLVERQCLEVLRRLGFMLEEGPEVESEEYNFDYLNIPKHHPAREMQDTFYVTGGLLLRSHTTSVQARVLHKRRSPPIKVASAGRVYRNEATDATHLPMFHQLEGFWLEKGLSFAHLRGILDFVGHEIFGEEGVFRIKPKFYPYTEPSIGMDIRCASCAGMGCGACHGAGWITIIGAGMIHRNVLLQFGYNPDEISGLAFGWGVTRMASQWTAIKKVKSLYQQDVRLLRGIHRRNG